MRISPERADGTVLALRNHALARKQRPVRQPEPEPPARIARAYDHVGDEYGCYADGDGLDDPSVGSNRFAHGDAIVWRATRQAIDELRAAGVSTLRVLDAGCGPGTWIRRIAAYAHRAGIGIEATGFDISTGQLEIARKRTASLAGCRSSSDRIEFLAHDLADPLPWSDGHFHIVLCNYVVLNHLAKGALPGAIEELCRVAAFRVIATVRALASPPTGCIIGTEQVLDYQQDCRRGQLSLSLKDGTRHVLTFNIFSAEVLEAHFARHASIVDLRAIDIFLSRFAADAKWTGNIVDDLPGRQEVIRKLKETEESLCRQPGWLDHGTHVLVVAEPRAQCSRGSNEE